MTPFEEETPQNFTLSREKLFYKIGEVSKIVGLQAYIIRYWESVFPQLRPKKSKAGQRVYTKKEIDLLFQIKKLQKEEGYTINGIKKKIKDLEMSVNNAPKKTTEIKVNTVSLVKERLKKILSEIS